MERESTRTFETRIKVDPLEDQLLHTFAALYAHVSHRLFADIASGKKAADLKNDYLACYEITARQFNAIRVQIEGKIASIKQRRTALIEESKERIQALTKKLSRLKAGTPIFHQKKRRLDHLKAKLRQLQEDHQKGTIRCCFGSRKRFRAQFDLEAGGYASHEEWLLDWKKARSREIFFLGSKDEIAGNQTCSATLQPDGTIQVRIRLPDALAKEHGKYLIIPQIDFKYGRQELHALLKNTTKKAISWRLLHDDKGWRLFATFDVEYTPPASREETGVIGLDINADHLALVETDRYGNPVSKQSIPFNLYGKSSDQAKAVIGDAAAKAVAYAANAHKPLVIEELDFQKKKGDLREKNNGSYSRMLSSFAYRSFITHLKSRAMKEAVLVKQINPAYTSVIGRIKFSRRYGLTIHQAAALSICRRSLGCSERVPLCLSKIPDGKDGHVTLVLPERNRNRHVWSIWRDLSKKLKTALAAHFRAAKSRSRSSCKSAPETGISPEVVGEIPTRESSEALLA